MNCHPCSIGKGKALLIDQGPKEKALSNVKAHINTSKHTSNVISMMEAEKNSVTKFDMVVQDKEKVC